MAHTDSMNESSYSSRSVCVMDAVGQLGSTLVHHLLRRGYTVHAALHTYSHKRFHGDHQVQYLEGLPCNNDEKRRLRIFQSDPLDYHSILDALKGCSGLFYCFEPLPDHPAYDELMAEVEVRAAHNVLEACAQVDTIDKVVFTSSATAVIWKDGRSMLSDFDERNWSDINFCKKYKLWHGLSKTLAEKTAWALAMDRDLNMVSVNAGLLVNSHEELTINNPYLKGAAEMYEDGVFVTVDLGFLVDAHICIFEDVSSYGRYLCFNQVINSSSASLELANKLSPPSSPPRAQSLEDDIVYEQKISNKKLNKLMVEFQNDGLIINS